jgi:hypothetical protein
MPFKNNKKSIILLLSNKSHNGPILQLGPLHWAFGSVRLLYFIKLIIYKINFE